MPIRMSRWASARDDVRSAADSITHALGWRHPSPLIGLLQAAIPDERGRPPRGMSGWVVHGDQGPLSRPAQRGWAGSILTA